MDDMILRAVIYYHILLISTVLGVGGTAKDLQSDVIGSRCLTGYMTDIQSWVDEFGRLSRHVDMSAAVSLFNMTNVMRNLENALSRTNSSRDRPIKYLSMTNCGLTRVPSVFRMEDSQGRRLADTLEYLTLYGNNFGTLDPYQDRYNVTMNAINANELPVPDRFQRRILTLWAQGFQNQLFRRLKELDLRACSIKVLGDNTFETMPELRSLYLGENNIFYIETHAFASMRSLRHLDISRNLAYSDDGNLEDLEFESLNIFKHLNLESLDSSFTRIGMPNLRIFRHPNKTLRRLSLCYSGLGRIRDDTFNETSLKILDVSGNPEILCSPNVLRGLEDHLQVLYAENVSLKNMEVFRNFSRLEILKLSNNEINTVPENITDNLKKLQILDLDNNRITSWNNDMVSLMPSLKLLSLKNNNINIITREMFYDIENLSFLGLSENFLVCNCHARDLFEVATNNELRSNITYFNADVIGIRDFKTFHTGFHDFNNVIRERNNITVFCEQRKECNVTFNDNITGNYLLLDYEDYLNQYRCLSVSEGVSTALYNVKSCAATNREANEKEDMILLESWNRYLLLLIPAILLPLLLFAFVFRKNFKYFLITIRNSAMLSLINKNDSPDETKDYCYDVFVSYCNEDRTWVLDKLLPHVEKDCNISVCLHERDFQVGLSILENIVSCMDRSRMIMLIISKRFLLSQWCQFEMHLAQHRLLETRREDLILVLLEEIPRRLRPNTLHYLMLTKTYIVWPEKEQSEQSVFWRRMKKSLVTHKLRSTENVSLA